MKYCYVLFVRTGFEENVVQKLKQRLDSSTFLPYVAKKEVFYKKNGRVYKEQELCFKGYVFIETDLFVDEFIKKTMLCLSTINEAYRFLSYGDKNDIVMKSEEKMALEKFFGVNFCMGASVAILIGDIVHIKSGALLGMEGIIRKINRHKKEAILEMELMGSKCQVSVGLEIVEKTLI